VCAFAGGAVKRGPGGEPNALARLQRDPARAHAMPCDRRHAFEGLARTAAKLLRSLAFAQRLEVGAAREHDARVPESRRMWFSTRRLRLGLLALGGVGVLVLVVYALPPVLVGRRKI
jgi:hypothetical protein